MSLNSLGTRSDQCSSDAVIHVNTEENLTKHPKSKISDDDDGATLYHFFSSFLKKKPYVFDIHHDSCYFHSLYSEGEMTAISKNRAP